MPATRAALFEGVGRPFAVREVELDPPGPEDVLVRMSAVGLCGSDLHVVRGEWTRPTPMILGHEGSGVVEQVGDGVEGLAPGDRVVILWAPSCRTCRACREGRPAACAPLRSAIAAGTLLDGTTGIARDGEPVFRMTAVGALAEHIVMPAHAVIPIPDSVPADEAALIGCAATTGVGAVENAARTQAPSSAMVIGAGGVGQFITQALRIAGAGEVVVVDPSEARRAIALELGARRALHPAEIEPDGDGHDLVFEAVGSAETCELALACTRSGGLAVLVGMTPHGTRLRIDPNELTVREKTLTGSLYGSGDVREMVRRILAHVEARRLDLAAALGPAYGLDDVNEAFAAALAGDQGRVIVRFTDGPGS